MIAAFFLNQLSQFALAVGVPYSAQNHHPSVGFGFWYRRFSIRWTVNAIKQNNTSVNGEKMQCSVRRKLELAAVAAIFTLRLLSASAGANAVLVRPQKGVACFARRLWRQQLASSRDVFR